MTGHGMANSKVLTNFPGVYQSAYLLEKPLYNENYKTMQTMGRQHYNSAVALNQNMLFLCIIILSFMLINC
jgi:hypothetical protein